VLLKAAPAVSASPGAPIGAMVVVAVAGAVRTPGLVRVPQGARVADAIAAAGGLRPGSGSGLLNLARKVSDGELIVVGDPPAGGAAPAAGAPGGRLLDLNTATVAQFDELPGVGPVLAQRIVEYRTAHGSFGKVEQLREVDGIGESRFQRLRVLVTV
jgi:competence protein ComEA